MENDSCWGFGEDGEGVNLMGVTLEKARDSLVAGEIQYTQDDPTAPTAPQESQNEELDIIIISDSMLAGVNQYMEGTKADLHVLSGATTSKVHWSLGNILKNRKPCAVVIHCGTNDLEDGSLTVIQETYQHNVTDILFLTGGTTIIMSGMIHRLDKPQLNERMNTINDLLQSLQTLDSQESGRLHPTSPCPWQARAQRPTPRHGQPNPGPKAQAKPTNNNTRHGQDPPDLHPLRQKARRGAVYHSIIGLPPWPKAVTQKKPPATPTK